VTFCRVKKTTKSPLRDILARNMRILRAERGWSQEYLAAEAGLNRTYLSAVERSEQNISLDNIYKISRALKVTAAELLECSSQ
jgi:transcriptional regulator with XRE-family HTH domain